MSEQFLSSPVRANRLQNDGAEVEELDVKLLKHMLVN